MSRGALVVVLGMVGVGKTSLLYALLGEMIQRRGSAAVAGSIAYAAQVQSIS